MTTKNRFGAGLAALSIAIVAVAIVGSLPSDAEKQKAIAAAEAFQRLYNENDLAGIVAGIEDREYIGRLLEYLRPRTGPCHMESARYRVYSLQSGRRLKLQATFDCENGPLGHEFFWNVQGDQLNLVIYGVDENTIRTIPGLSENIWKILPGR